MGSNLSPVPAGAESLSSFQLYQSNCQTELYRRGISTPFDPQHVMVFNREPGDGNVELLYQDPANDFSCTAQLHWSSQELLIRSGQVSDRTSKPLAGTWVPDACTATKALAGEEELDGKTCRDDVADARLIGSDKFNSVQEFTNRCRKIFDQYGSSHYGMQLGDRFDLKRSRIVNPVLGEGMYSLLFESRANNFFCEGDVDSSAHRMFLRSGAISALETAEPSEAVEMTDTCSMTTALLGAEELVRGDKCQDRSSGERKLEDYLTYGFYGIANAIALWGTYKIGKRILFSNTLWSFARLPLVRNLGWGMVGYYGFDAIASHFVGEDHPIRKYGKWVAGGVGVVAPEVIGRTALGTRLAQTAFGARLAPIASRATIGLAAVWGMNQIFKHWVVGNDYDAYVNKRITDKVYDKNVYELDGWDLLVVPLLFKGVRASCRFVAPNAMEWGVGRDHDDVREQVYAEDRKASAEAEQSIRDTLPSFLHAENGEDVNEAIALLRDAPIELSDEEKKMALVLQQEGYADLRSQYPQLNDDQAEHFCRKVLMQQVQEAAKYLVFVEQPENDWARELFNKDGTLKGGATPSGEYPFMRLRSRWPAPAPEKTTTTSEAYDVIPLANDMA